MSDFIMISDCNCALAADERKEFGVAGYPKGSIIFPDGTAHKISLDWDEISAEDFYGSMKNGKAMYKTAACSEEDVFEVMKPFLDDGKDILAITISQNMSASFSIFSVAAKKLMEEYPGRKISVVDSRGYSVMIAMLFEKANKMRSEGKTLDEVTAWLEENKYCVHQMGLMDDLKFVARSGRISGAKAFFGQMVGVNSLAECAYIGMPQAIGTIKGRRKAMETDMEYIKRTIVEPERQTVYIGHTLRDSEVELYKGMIIDAVHPKDVRVLRVEMGSGANIGPGLLAAFYFGEPVTKDLGKETAILNEAIEAVKNNA